jgi:hypothetical protein
LVSPTIRNLKVTKVLVDGGAGLNPISLDVIRRLQIPDGDLQETGTFQGVNPGRSQPTGKISLPVTFGTKLSYRTEKVVFDVIKIPLPYNGILGRPALAKFMAASHYAYNTLKMPGPMSIVTIHSDRKDAVICADNLYRAAVAASAIKVLAPAGKPPGGGKKKKKTGKTSNEASGKRTSECSTPVEDIPESSTGKSKKAKASTQATKQVSAREDGMSGTFSISATLSDK